MIILYIVRTGITRIKKIRHSISVHENLKKNYQAEDSAFEIRNKIKYEYLRYGHINLRGHVWLDILLLNNSQFSTVSHIMIIKLLFIKTEAKHILIIKKLYG